MVQLRLSRRPKRPRKAATRLLADALGRGKVSYTGAIMKTARVTPWFLVGFLAVLSVFGDAARAQQAPAQQPALPADGPTPTFRTSVNLVSSDVIVRNRRGQFQADLTKDDFELYEDGIKQDLSSFVLVHGGRVYQTQTATVAPVREGIILPASRPVNDTAGRIIIFVVDDLHMEFRDTHRVRKLFRDMAKELDSRR